MSANVNTVSAEAFRGTTFFGMSLPFKFGRVKVKDSQALGRYLAQLAGEIEAQKTTDGNGNTLSGEALAVEVEPALLRALAQSGSFKLPKMISTNKALLVSPALDAIKEFQTKTKEKLCGRFGQAVPSRVKEGLFVVQNEFVQQFEDELNAASVKLAADFVPAFIADYDRARDHAANAPLLQGGLGPLFDLRDYPDAAKLPEMFGLDWSWLALGVPEDLPPALKAQAAEKFERQMTEAAEEVKTALRASLAGFIDNAVDRLSSKAGEKPKVFRDSLIENIRDFCAVFESRNFLKDDALAALVEQSRQVIEAVDPEKLRKFESVRDSTAAGFAKIKAQLDTMIVEKKGRAFDLE